MGQRGALSPILRQIIPRIQIHLKKSGGSIGLRCIRGTEQRQQHAAAKMAGLAAWGMFGAGLPTPPSGGMFGAGLPTPPSGGMFGAGLPTPPIPVTEGL
jgi:hypothetical protein